MAEYLDSFINHRLEGNNGVAGLNARGILEDKHPERFPRKCVGYKLLPHNLKIICICIYTMVTFTC